MTTDSKFSLFSSFHNITKTLCNDTTCLVYEVLFTNVTIECCSGELVYVYMHGGAGIHQHSAY